MKKLPYHENHNCLFAEILRLHTAKKLKPQFESLKNIHAVPSARELLYNIVFHHQSGKWVWHPLSTT